MNIVLLGPPGAGKGSLSALCVHHFGWMQCSTGNLCRQYITDNSEIGQQIAFSIKSGKLIADSLIVRMVDAWLSEQDNCMSPVILDGFPRTIVQAQVLDNLLKKPLLSVCKLIVVQIVLSDDMVVQRLTKRIICENQECQAVYAHNDLYLAPKQEGICDKCEYKLIRRADDTEDSIKERLKVYRQHAQELLLYYHNQKRPIVELKADKPLEQVFNIFKNIMGLKC